MHKVVDIDNFINLFLYLGQIYDKKIDKVKLYSHVNSEFGYSVDDILKISEKIGFELKYTEKYRLHEIVPPLLPVILLLKEAPVLLLEINKKDNQVTIIDSDGNKKEVNISKLDREYTGKIFLVKPVDSLEKELYVPKKIHWFWNSLKFSLGLYIDVFIATFLLNIFALLTPLFVRNIYDRVVPNAAFDTLYILSIGIVIIYIFDFIFRFLRMYLLEIASKKSDIIISSKLFEQILNMKLSYKFKSVGAFASNIREFDTLRNFLSSATLTILIDIPFIILFLFVIYILAGPIIIVPLIAAILIVGYGFIIASRLKKYIDETAQLSSWKNGVLIESLSSLEAIKSFGLNSMMQWRWEDAVGDIATANMKTKILTTSMSMFTNFVIQLSNVLVIILGVYAIYEKSLTMGGLIAVTMLTSRALTPLVQISLLIVNYEYAKKSYQILDDIFSTPVEKEKRKRYISRDEIIGCIEFRNVSFSYPNTEERILDNVNFKVDAGETIAVLGSNGSGKTTLLKLLMGFYEPSEGSILIDGIDIRQIDPDVLRNICNYMPQDITLFRGTIFDNIRYASAKATDEEIVNSIKLSGLNTFVDLNPLGHDFPVEERGEGVSGGQKQLIGLSRSFLKKESNILLLDEPSNALDSQTERLVLKNIQFFMQGKTTFLVTHKRNFIELASRIIVLNHGKIVYDGSKNEVLKALEGGT